MARDLKMIIIKDGLLRHGQEQDIRERMRGGRRDARQLEVNLYRGLSSEFQVSDDYGLSTTCLRWQDMK